MKQTAAQPGGSTSLCVLGIMGVMGVLWFPAAGLAAPGAQGLVKAAGLD